MLIWNSGYAVISFPAVHAELQNRFLRAGGTSGETERVSHAGPRPTPASP
jgi:hypothetical protein